MKELASRSPAPLLLLYTFDLLTFKSLKDDTVENQRETEGFEMRRNYQERCESAAPIIPPPVNKAPVLHPNRCRTSR